MAEKSEREKKKAIVDERMRMRALCRQKDRQAASASPAGVNKKKEAVEAFWTAFNEKKTHFVSCIQQPTATPKEKSTPAHVEAEECLKKQQQLIENAMPYLTAYDVQHAQASLTDGFAILNKKKSECGGPPKKFQFRSRRKKKQAAVQKEEKTLVERAKPQEETPKGITEKDTKASFPSSSKEVNSHKLLCRMKNAKISKKGAGTVSPADFAIKELEGCTVVVEESTGALRLCDLTNCNIYCGPVHGSIMIYRCTGCTFGLAAQQIRVHDTKHCNFYVKVKSGPIIENCTALRFAPYHVSYEGLLSQLKEANMSDCDNKWDHVKDFDFPHADASDNWSIIGISERERWSAEL